MSEFTVPGMTDKEAAQVAELLQKQLSRYNLSLDTSADFRSR